MPETDCEVWKPCPVLPEYAVSSHGRVRRTVKKKGAGTKILAQKDITRAGYRRVRVRSEPGVQQKWSVHRLVALTFLGPPPSPAHMVAHGDGDRLNNCVSNLRWATCKENHADRARHGNTACGERSGVAKLTDSDVLAIRASHLPPKTLAAEYGISSEHVRRLQRRENWRHLA